MPKLVRPLTDIQPRSAKPADKPFKLADGGGMYLLVNPDGGKYWRMDYRHGGKRKTLAFGTYPQTSLAEAREKRMAARKLLDQEIDPGQAKKEQQRIKSAAAANTFEAVGRAWHSNNVETWQPRTAQNILHRLEQDIFPLVGARPITELKAPVMLEVIQQIEKRGAGEVARRNAQVCSRIFDFAIASGIAENNPMPALRTALKPRIKGHHAAILVADLPDFLLALQENEARMFAPTRILMRLMLLTFVRTSELTETPWSEIDLENEQWVIPWQRMKMGRRKMNPRKVNHQVFLPPQGWVLLRELHRYTGGGKYLFPNQRDHAKPVSNGAILAALKRLGYGGKHTGHGFRSLAKGILKTLKHDISNIERQLAHASGEAYGEAYDRESFLEERRAMMAEYANYLEAVERGNVVIANFGKAA